MDISIKNVSKIIDGEVILRNVTMELTGGKIYGFQGENGSGKTMLMRVISGLIHPTEGIVEIDGKILGKDLSFPPDMGIMLETPAFLDSYTGRKNLEMLASIRGKHPDIARVLTQVGLDPNDKRKYKKYSLGMKQRLGIGCAVMENPSLLILDEPFNSLDKEGQKGISKIILEMRDRGCLVLLSAHNQAQLESLSDEIYLVKAGYYSKR